MGQYFDNEKLKSELNIFKTRILNNEYSFYTDNGVFSKNKLDFGTRTLLESIDINEIHGKVLDVGCGYGVIDIILSKVTNASFEGIDVNLRALHLASMNVKLNNVSNVKFYESNVYENVNSKYNFIITNPPIRAGKDVVYKMLFGAKDYLKECGKLFFVMRKNQGVKSTIKDLKDIYNVEVIDKKNGFFVIRCILH